MLSKMAQPNNSGGSGGAAGGGNSTGRRPPLSLSAGGPMGKVQHQHVDANNGRSNSPHTANTNATKQQQPQQLQQQQPYVTLKDNKKTMLQQLQVLAEEKKSQNGVNTSGKNSANKKDKASQNGNTAARDSQELQKEPKVRDKELKVTEEASTTTKAKKGLEKEAKKVVNLFDNIANTAVPENIDNDDDVILLEATGVGPSTPTADRRSARKAAVANQQKSPSQKTLTSNSPIIGIKKKEVDETADELSMDVLAVEPSPPRKASAVANPSATSTPGRNLFDARPIIGDAVAALAPQLASSPISEPPRTYAQICGRRSIRVAAPSPGQMGGYRSNNSLLNNSSLSNTSMNATCGSEANNTSILSFSFLRRGVKRERTPPTDIGSQSAAELTQDVVASPPKRGRFELLSQSLASPFTMLRTRFSKASISTPARLRLERTPPLADEEREVQNVSGIVIEEEHPQSLQQTGDNITLGQEATQQTPTKDSTPEKIESKNMELKRSDADADTNIEGDSIAALEKPADETGEGVNKSRCAIM